MNAKKARWDQEIADLARILPAVADRDMPADRQRHLKEHLMSEVQAARPRFRAVSWPKFRTTTLALASGIATLAVVVTATILGAQARHAGPGGGPALNGHAAATSLLNEIAIHAERSPAPKPRDNQFTFVELKVGPGYPKPGHPGAARKLESEFIWTSVSNICIPTEFLIDGGRVDTLPPTKPCPSTGTIDDPTYRLLESLPTNPKKLLELIKTAKPKPVQSLAVAVPERLSPSAREFRRIGNLLEGAIAPPRLYAALYRAAAMIPGVTVVHHAVDAIGRPGIAVAFTQGGTRYEWIFNRKTLQLLGERQVRVSTGKVVFKTAIILREFVDQRGEITGNAVPSPSKSAASAPSKSAA
ncbi:MAG TPA: CU044_5270 family protein [Streptosporangiaceae bacterium]|nr:CU044_5270 family protein [Streptosporangiaceae bacterium]